MYIQVGAVGTEDLEESLSQLRVFPNPAKYQINIEIYDKEFINSQILILNTIGSIVYSENLSSKSSIESIDISNLSKGIYLIKLVNKDKKKAANSFIIE